MCFCFRQDGLWLVSQQPSVIQGYHRGILTPNIMEFTRLYESLVRLWTGLIISHESDLLPCVHVTTFFVWLPQHHEPMDNTDHKRNVMQLSGAMGNVTLVLKGEQDLISDGSKGSYDTQSHTTSDLF